MIVLICCYAICGIARLDSDPCRGGGSLLLVGYYVIYILFLILCLDLLMLNPLLPLAGRLAT